MYNPFSFGFESGFILFCLFVCHLTIEVRSTLVPAVWLRTQEVTQSTSCLPLQVLLKLALSWPPFVNTICQLSHSVSRSLLAKNFCVNHSSGIAKHLPDTSIHCMYCLVLISLLLLMTERNQTPPWSSYTLSFCYGNIDVPHTFGLSKSLLH